MTDAVYVDDPHTCEAPVAAKQVDATLREPALLTGVRVVRNHEVAPRERGADVDFGLRRRLAGTVDGLARTQQGFRRNARPLGALAADELALDEGDTQPTFSESADTVLAGRATADDDDVIFAQGGSSVPVCSAAMYAAYPSALLVVTVPILLVILSVRARVVVTSTASGQSESP